MSPRHWQKWLDKMRKAFLSSKSESIAINYLTLLTKVFCHLKPKQNLHYWINSYLYLSGQKNREKDVIVCGQFWTISAIVYNCTAFSLCLLPSFFVKQNQEETISFPTLLCSVPYYWLVKTTDRSTELVCCALSSQCYSFGFLFIK